MVIEPEVKFVQAVELTDPPGFIGKSTGDFLPFCIGLELPLIDSIELIFVSRLEFELSKVLTLSSNKPILLLRSDKF